MKQSNIKVDFLTFDIAFIIIIAFYNMGTSMSDSKSTFQYKYVPRSRVVITSIKRHQSLEKITLKGITDSSRVLSQSKIR